jgi:hypothetical protein
MSHSEYLLLLAVIASPRIVALSIVTVVLIIEIIK